MFLRSIDTFPRLLHHAWSSCALRIAINKRVSPENIRITERIAWISFLPSFLPSPRSESMPNFHHATIIIIRYVSTRRITKKKLWIARWSIIFVFSFFFFPSSLLNYSKMTDNDFEMCASRYPRPWDRCLYNNAYSIARSTRYYKILVVSAEFLMIDRRNN